MAVDMAEREIGVLSDERIEEIARTAAREVVQEEVAKAEAPLHILEHTAVGHAMVVDAAKAERTPCKVFSFGGVHYGFSPGCIGLISEKTNPEQFARFCKTTVPLNDGITKRFERIKSGVEEAHKEWEKSGDGLPEWWEAVSKHVSFE